MLRTMTDFTSTLPPDAPKNAFDRLCWIMDRLLDPESGCPWDKEQTHESLKQYLIEEAYEVYDAIESGDKDHLKEELGDVALQVVFHSAVAQRNGHFIVDEVLDAICEKLVRRHPHVFGNVTVDGAGQVLTNWEQIKQGERTKKEKDNSLVAGIPRALPALQKALRIQDKVRRVGFDWPGVAGALDKVEEEFRELDEEIRANPPESGVQATERQVEEFGDLLFSLVNVGRLMGVRPEEALQATCDKFSRRFRHIERRAAETGRDLRDMTLEEMDIFWNEAKSL